MYLEQSQPLPCQRARFVPWLQSGRLREASWSKDLYWCSWGKSAREKWTRTLGFCEPGHSACDGPICEACGILHKHSNIKHSLMSSLFNIRANDPNSYSTVKQYSASLRTWCIQRLILKSTNYKQGCARVHKHLQWKRMHLGMLLALQVTKMSCSPTCKSPRHSASKQIASPAKGSKWCDLCQYLELWDLWWFMISFFMSFNAKVPMLAGSQVIPVTSHHQLHSR